MTDRTLPSPEAVASARWKLRTADRDLWFLVQHISSSMTPPYYELEGFTEVYLKLLGDPRESSSLIGAAAVMQVVMIKKEVKRMF